MKNFEVARLFDLMADVLELRSEAFVAGLGGEKAALKVKVAGRREFAGYWEYLLDNAIYYTPEGSAVTVLLSRSDRSFATATPSLSVMLNGAGMPQSRSAPPASSTYISSGSSSTMSIPGTALTAKSSAHSAEPSSFTIVLTVFFIRSTPQKSTLEQNSMVLIV